MAKTVLSSILLSIAFGRELMNHRFGGKRLERLKNIASRFEFPLKYNNHMYAGRRYTVDGLSSGAFFAVDYGVAFSSEVRGIDVVAGGPYYCAKASETVALTDCMSEPSLINLNQLESDTTKFASQGDIDPVSNIANMSVYVFAGEKDTVVNPKVGGDCADYFKHFGANVIFENDIKSQHGMVTDNYGTKCDPLEAEAPYIENCGYDLAGAMLKFQYGTLKPRVSYNDLPYNNVLSLDQTPFMPAGKTASSISMEKIAYYYKPNNCTVAPLSENCNLHVVFHGCKMYLESECLNCGTKNNKYNDTYVRHAGYNQWAEPNNIVVLYPQADNSELAPENPEGCWDWWGYNTKNYAFQNGEQISTVHKMIQYVLTGSKSTSV